MNFVRTNAFRLVALVFGLFAGSTMAVLGFVYWSTANFAEGQAAATLQLEVDVLAEEYRQAGLPGLVSAILERSTGEHGNAFMYLLADPYGARLAGNLTAWPAMEGEQRGWVSFPVYVRRGSRLEAHPGRGVTLRLPGGFRLLVGRDMSESESFRRRVAETLGWAGLLTLGLGLLTAVVASRNMLRRVEAVSDTAARIVHGDLTQRVPVSGSGDEFDQLAGNLNEMLDRIERLMEGMRQVSDNIAHDLRTPLSRLRTRLEMALLEPPDAARGAEVMRETIAEADALLGTFNALLSITQAEAGTQRAPPEEVDLAEIARAVCELYEPVAEEAGVELTAEIEAPVHVRGDRHLISQAAANLVDNALKYAVGGPISVTARRAPGEALLIVADRGPGIPPEQRDRVFDRFVRLEASRSTPGQGLGLSLVRAVARLHGGSVRLEDNEPGLRAVLALPDAPGARSA